MNSENDPIWPYIVGVLIHIAIFAPVLPDGAIGLLIFLDIVFAIALYNKK